MKITVNGKEQDYNTPEMNITNVLLTNGVKKPELVSVQLNEQFIEQSQFNDIIVKEHDAVDFIYFMGGGAGF